MTIVSHTFNFESHRVIEDCFRWVHETEEDQGDEKVESVSFLGDEAEEDQESGIANLRFRRRLSTSLVSGPEKKFGSHSKQVILLDK